jgi:hypothetical protein
MLGDVVLRFVLGGTLVSVFGVIAAAFKPRSFSGLFAAAPAVAIASLAITYSTDGAATTAAAARWMLAGALALFGYSACSVALCQTRVPAWLAATTAWLVWLAVAVMLWFSLRHVVRT